MLYKIPPYVLDVFKKFKKSNFQIYLVGGSVRGLLTKRQVDDWDFTTNATPQQILKLFPNGFYDNKFGTVGIPIKETVLELTTFRTETAYKDRRHPEKIEWGKTVEEDLARRDFTINAIALDLEDQKIIDPFKGQTDLKNKIIK